MPTYNFKGPVSTTVTTRSGGGIGVAVVVIAGGAYLLTVCGGPVAAGVATVAHAVEMVMLGLVTAALASWAAYRVIRWRRGVLAERAILAQTPAAIAARAVLPAAQPALPASRPLAIEAPRPPAVQDPAIFDALMARLESMEAHLAALRNGGQSR